MKYNLIPLLFIPFLQTSRIHISDGDTIRLDNQRIRLACIDAPESDQPFGSQSTQRLSQIVGNGSNLQVRTVDRDRYGRTIAKLYVGDLYVQEQLVRDGLAWVYTQCLNRCPTTAGSLLRAQEEAQVYRRGVWSSDESIAPWQWRQR
ncbi:MAG: thermonuclease family protein [Synechococcaceae cyanobacterium SM2_3_2]|nr:thermonuclease family protein [Synechococcaceae cyanobacterium SM2_3_2]